MHILKSVILGGLFLSGILGATDAVPSTLILQKRSTENDNHISTTSDSRTWVVLELGPSKDDDENIDSSQYVHQLPFETLAKELGAQIAQKTGNQEDDVSVNSISTSNDILVNVSVPHEDPVGFISAKLVPDEGPFYISISTKEGDNVTVRHFPVVHVVEKEAILIPKPLKAFPIINSYSWKTWLYFGLIAAGIIALALLLTLGVIYCGHSVGRGETQDNKNLFLVRQSETPYENGAKHPDPEKHPDFDSENENTPLSQTEQPTKIIEDNDIWSENGWNGHHHPHRTQSHPRHGLSSSANHVDHLVEVDESATPLAIYDPRHNGHVFARNAASPSTLSSLSSMYDPRWSGSRPPASGSPNSLYHAIPYTASRTPSPAPPREPSEVSDMTLHSPLSFMDEDDDDDDDGERQQDIFIPSPMESGASPDLNQGNPFTNNLRPISPATESAASFNLVYSGRCPEAGNSLYPQTRSPTASLLTRSGQLSPSENVSPSASCQTMPPTVKSGKARPPIPDRTSSLSSHSKKKRSGGRKFEPGSKRVSMPCPRMSPETAMFFNTLQPSNRLDTVRPGPPTRGGAPTRSSSMGSGLLRASQQQGQPLLSVPLPYHLSGRESSRPVSTSSKMTLSRKEIDRDIRPILYNLDTI